MIVQNKLLLRNAEWEHYDSPSSFSVGMDP